MSALKRAIASLLGGESEDVAANRRARYKQIIEDLDEMREEFKDLRATFVEGGPVSLEAMRAYAVSEPGELIGYPTGKHVISYRLPDLADGSMIFKVVCAAPKGKLGSFGVHWHPAAIETCIQWRGRGRTAERDLPPLSVTTFLPDERHDYFLAPAAELLVIFRPHK